MRGGRKRHDGGDRNTKTIKGIEEREKKKCEAIKVMRMTLTRLREVRYIQP